MRTVFMGVVLGAVASGCFDSGDFVGEWSGTVDVAVTRTQPLPEGLSGYARSSEGWRVVEVADALREQADVQVIRMRDGEAICLLDARFTERGRVSLAAGQSCLFGSALSTLQFGRLEGGDQQLALQLSWNWTNPRGEKGTFMETGSLRR